MPIGKGKAAKSSSGASMSAYDVEVEGRLKKLETTLSDVVAMVNALQAHEHDAPATGSDARVEAVVAKLKAEEPGKWKDL